MVTLRFFRGWMFWKYALPDGDVFYSIYKIKGGVK